MKVTDNVYKIDCTKGSYAYAVRTDDGVTLIDTSLPGKAGKILLELDSYKIDSKEINKVLLTHHDIDHISNVAFFSRKCGCDVYISETDLPYALGEKKRDGIKKILGALMKVEMPKTIKIFEGDRVGDFQIISTPGHTRGHSCFRYKNVLFTGDLISEKNGIISTAPKIMTWDMPTLIESTKRIDLNGVEWICPAHGEPVKANLWDDYLNRIS